MEPGLAEGSRRPGIAGISIQESEIRNRKSELEIGTPDFEFIRAAVPRAEVEAWRDVGWMAPRVTVY